MPAIGTHAATRRLRANPDTQRQAIRIALYGIRVDAVQPATATVVAAASGFSTALDMTCRAEHSVFTRIPYYAVGADQCLP